MSDPRDDLCYFVIIERKGRMYTAKESFETRTGANEYVATKGGVAILEWTRERKPQFAVVWASPEVGDISVLLGEKFNGG